MSVIRTFIAVPIVLVGRLTGRTRPKWFLELKGNKHE